MRIRYVLLSGLQVKVQSYWKHIILNLIQDPSRTCLDAESSSACRMLNTRELLRLQVLVKSVHAETFQV